MESDGDTDKCIYTAEVKTSLYILDKKVKRLVHIDSVFFLLFLLQLLIMILFVQISHLVYNPKHMKSIPTLFH